MNSLEGRYRDEWPEDGVTGDELLEEVDRRMYAHKNRLKQKRPITRAIEEQPVMVQ